MQSETRQRRGARSAIGWLADMLWRRRDVSRGTYAAVAAGASLSISLFVAVLYFLVAVQLLGLDLPADVPDRNVPLVLDFLGLIAFAPLTETLALALLVGIARGLTDREGVHVLAGALPLGLAHGVLGMTLADVGGHALVSVFSFLVFSIAYVAWRRESFKSAFWMCAAVHAVHNGAMFVAMAADGTLGG